MRTRGSLENELAGWVAADLIGADQAQAILDHVRAGRHVTESALGTRADGRRPRVPAVAEALGYLGATLAVVGLVLVVSRYWNDMELTGHLLLTGFAAALCTGAGLSVREGVDPAFDRLRWSLWLGSTAAVVVFAGVAATDGLPTDAPETIVLAAAGAAALHSGLLWFGRERPVQQLVALGGLVVTAGAATTEVTSGWPIGTVIWTCGVQLTAVGLRRRTPTPLVTLAVGSTSVVVGATTLSAHTPGPGLLLLLVSGFALAAMALVPGTPLRPQDRFVVGGIGALALVQGVPGTLAHYGPEAAVAAGVATWLVGTGLVSAGHRRLVHLSQVVEFLGGLAMIGGAALTAVQWPDVAPIFGIATAVGFLVAGTAPERLLLSVLGSLGLLINLPWAIGRFFPGEGRVPLLIMVSGVLIVVLAVLLARRSGRRGARPPLRLGPVPQVREDEHEPLQPPVEALGRPHAGR